MGSTNLQIVCNGLAALCAIIAAILWIKSARVEVWADQQIAPRRDNLVIEKNGRHFDVSGTAEAQSLWSARAAYAAAAAAAFQSVAIALSIGG